MLLFIRPARRWRRKRRLVDNILRGKSTGVVDGALAEPKSGKLALLSRSGPDLFFAIGHKHSGPYCGAPLVAIAQGTWRMLPFLLPPPRREERQRPLLPSVIFASLNLRRGWISQDPASWSSWKGLECLGRCWGGSLPAGGPARPRVIWRVGGWRTGSWPDPQDKHTHALSSR